MVKYKDYVPIAWLCSWTGLSRSSWYYGSSCGKRGCKPSTHTYRMDGSKVTNNKVVEDVKALLRDEFIACYGYERLTWELHDLGYHINKKKVYRLMKDARLIHSKHRVHTTGKRRFVETRKIHASYPLQYLSMDIKYVYIQGEQRNVYLFTVIDVFTRRVVGHLLKSSIKQHDVVLLLDGILQEYQVEGIMIRNDNGSQFIAHSVREFLRDRGVTQEFTHIATPEENAYIEALHSILEREIITRYWFDSLYHAKMKINDYYKFYNSRRKHRSLKRQTPDQFWMKNMNQKIVKPNVKPLNLLN